MLGPFATASRLTPIHQGSLAVLSRAACTSMSTTSTTTTTTRDRGDRYGPMEWAQLCANMCIHEKSDCAGHVECLQNFFEVSSNFVSQRFLTSPTSPNYLDSN